MPAEFSHAAAALVVLAGTMAAAPSAAWAGPTYYFSDCQAGAATTCVPGDDARPGTTPDAPRRSLSALDVNALPAGSKLLLARGGVWLQPTTLLLDNPHATAQQPLVIDAYGSGDRPWIKAPGLQGAVIAFGKYGNTSYDGGYTVRNLKLDGAGSALWGVFLVHNLHHVTLENNEITGFHIGIHSQSRGPHGVTQVLIRNNSISRNRGMGILGQFSDSVIEGNLFEANNTTGSAYSHAIYLSGNEAGGRHNVVRNNLLRGNSVVNGVCTGGNFTLHGQMEDMLIEGNTIEQAAASRSCRGISITSGYASPEWFRGFVVRRNTLVNLGGCGICVNAAPGIVVEGNRFFSNQGKPHKGVSIRDDGGAGDDPGHGPIVRDNVACFASRMLGQELVSVNVPGAVLSGNETYRGAAATAGACAR